MLPTRRTRASSCGRQSVPTLAVMLRLCSEHLVCAYIPSAGCRAGKCMAVSYAVFWGLLRLSAVSCPCSLRCYQSGD